MPESTTNASPIFTVQEVNDRIPLLEKIGADLVRLNDRKQDLIQMQGTRRDDSSGEIASQLTLREGFRKLKEELDSLQVEILEVGGHFRDLSTATIEFLCEVNDCMAWLSWRPGDQIIRAWRPLHGDKSERLALPGHTLPSSDGGNRDRELTEEND